MNSYASSSWREQDITLASGVNTVYFTDTKPNMFLIQNPNPHDIYVSIAKIPTDENYECVVMKNSTKTHGRPTRTSVLYIYNPVQSEFNVKVFSVYDTFDMNILSTFNVMLEGASVTTDGIVKGFAKDVSLPSGSHVIGKVHIVESSLSPIMDLLSGVSEANADNAEVIKTAVNTMQNALETAIDKLPKKLVDSDLNGSFNTNADEVTIGDFNEIHFNKLIMISNHSEEDMRVRVYFKSDAYFEFFLAPHDFISDLEVNAYAIKVWTGVSGCAFSVYGGVY